MARKFTAIVSLIFILGCVHGSAFAAVTYIAGPNVGAVPQTYFFESDTFNAGGGRQFTSEAGPFALRAKLGVKNGNVDNQFTSISVSDVIFTSTDPNKTTTSVTFRAMFSGTAPGSGFNYSPNGRIFLNGVGDIETLTPPATSISETLSVTTVVPLNTPITVSADMEMRLSAPFNLTGFLNFDDSLSFFPNEVFLLEPGVTANSASWGLVDNGLTSVIPEPSALAISLGLTSFVLAGPFNHRRRSVHRPSSCKRVRS